MEAYQSRPSQYHTSDDVFDSNLTKDIDHGLHHLSNEVHLDKRKVGDVLELETVSSKKSRILAEDGILWDDYKIDSKKKDSLIEQLEKKNASNAPSVEFAPEDEIDMEVIEYSEDISNDHHNVGHITSVHKIDQEINSTGSISVSNGNKNSQVISNEPSMKKSREERRNKQKLIIKNFVCMLTTETEEVEKGVPAQQQEQLGIEKQILWDIFQKWIDPTEGIASASVFWKYTCGKTRQQQQEPPVYASSDYHREVLKNGVKRLSGVRWREPSLINDREKMSYHMTELMSFGYELDIDAIVKDIIYLSKDPDRRVKNTKSSNSKKTKTQVVQSSNSQSSPIPFPVNEAQTNQLHQPQPSQHNHNTIESLTNHISEEAANFSQGLIDPNHLQQLIHLLSNLLNVLQHYAQGKTM